jgi:hypothetical protein
MIFVVYGLLMMFILLVVSLGWYIVWRLFLFKIPIFQEFAQQVFSNHQHTNNIKASQRKQHNFIFMRSGQQTLEKRKKIHIRQIKSIRNVKCDDYSSSSRIGDKEVGKKELLSESDMTLLK